MYKLLISILALALFSGCSTNAVQYQPDFNLVNTMKDANLETMNVGDITSSNPKVNKISIRGSSMVSTFNNSYADYLEDALREQIQQANLFDASSKIVILGDLLKNDLNATGISIGTADISARFIVQNAGKIVFDKVITINHEWDSSFVGAIAIPNAINNYPIAVQKLITALMSDKEFISAVQKTKAG